MRASRNEAFLAILIGLALGTLAASDGAKKPVAVERGRSYLRTRLADQPAGLTFAYMLHRRFRVDDFGDAPEAYEKLVLAPSTKSSPPKGALRLFRRLLFPDSPFDEADVAELQIDFDEVTARALHCSASDLPPSFGERLREDALRGGYHLTHVGLALGWMRDNGCTWPVERELVDEWVDQMSLVAAGPPGDLSFEAAAVLRYLGHRERVPATFDEILLENQNPDGGWSVSGEAADSHWHTTILALWALLEEMVPEKSDVFVPQAAAAPSLSSK